MAEFGKKYNGDPRTLNEVYRNPLSGEHTLVLVGTNNRRMVISLDSGSSWFFKIKMTNTEKLYATEDYFSAWKANNEPGECEVQTMEVNGQTHSRYLADTEALPSLIKMLFEPVPESEDGDATYPC